MRGTVSVPVYEGADWTAFLKARGADIKEGWATIAYRKDVKEPIVPITYGPRKTDMLLVKHVCAQLDDDGSCKLHGSSDFPSVCRNYPRVDDDLSIVPNCGFEIVEDTSSES